MIVFWRLKIGWSASFKESIAPQTVGIANDWPGSTPEKQRRLRMERSRLRCDFELLKIDLRKVERQVVSLSQARI